jgi:hypothetical protein
MEHSVIFYIDDSVSEGPVVSLIWVGEKSKVLKQHGVTS